MKKTIRSVVLAFIFVLAVVSGCAPAPTPLPPTPTLTPTITPPPTATLTPTLEYVPVELKGRAFWAGTDAPISDFTVILGDPEEFTATTNADGNYSFKDLKPGKYALSVKWEMDRTETTGSCEDVQITLQSLALPISGEGRAGLVEVDTVQYVYGVGWELEINEEDPFLQFKLQCP